MIPTTIPAIAALNLSSTPGVSTPNATPHLENSRSASPTANSNTPAARKLRQAAAEFESMMISNLWKSMKTTFADDDDAD